MPVMAICLASHGHNDNSTGSSKNKRAHRELAQKKKNKIRKEREVERSSRDIIIVL